MASRRGAPCVILPPGADDEVTPLNISAVENRVLHAQKTK